MKKDKELEAILVITLGFMIVYKVFETEWLFFTALAIGILGTFISFFRKYLVLSWMRLASILNMIVPKLLLGLIFYLVLFPMSIFSKLFRSDNPIVLKKPELTNFTDSNKKFNNNDFLNTW
ncbi:hypothetical protein [Algoriphagus hitonicola]|uniref:Uncharacterized protein n=1 Tax=Algoriphagus hitonicola TaxID=435880 RepID=A0A1I2X590_9BACT|nr:hypothetical protein [Algoriphagus hitonicola]SFH07856.1 hypothetical protein SAMN04487988_1163 [Algoriphagus hitonicola]